MVEAHLNMLKSKSTKDTLGLALLILGLHERVEISININISDGLTNVAVGRVVGLPRTDSSRNCNADGYILGSIR